MTSLEEEKRMVQGWRGRRYLACRAMDVLERVIDNLGYEDGVNPPPDGGLPKVQDQLRIEAGNQAAVLLRTILAMNDGQTSGSRLQRF